MANMKSLPRPDSVYRHEAYTHDAISRGGKFLRDVMVETWWSEDIRATTLRLSARALPTQESSISRIQLMASTRHEDQYIDAVHHLVDAMLRKSSRWRAAKKQKDYRRQRYGTDGI